MAKVEAMMEDFTHGICEACDSHGGIKTGDCAADGGGRNFQFAGFYNLAMLLLVFSNWDFISIINQYVSCH